MIKDYGRIYKKVAEIGSDTEIVDRLQRALVYLKGITKFLESENAESHALAAHMIEDVISEIIKRLNINNV